MKNTIVELRNLKIHYLSRMGLFRNDVVKAVDGVSLELSRSEMVALVGESGCGKSTLGRASLRLVRANEGQVFFNGEDITHLSEKDIAWFRRRAQMIFQDPYSSMDPFMNVAQVISEPLEIHKMGNEAEIRKMVLLTLENVGLTPPEEIAKKYPHQLSGGQRQRVGIARALVLNPDYLVVDEPVSMIDASSRAGIMYLLEDLRRKYGVTFLYITHDIATAKHFSDRIAVMYLGRIIEEGPTEEVIQDPLHPYTKALLDTIPEPDPKNRFQIRPSISGEPPSSTKIPFGCRFHPRCKSYVADKCGSIDPSTKNVRVGRKIACLLH